MRYFGNGSGRDSYIIKDFGGMMKPKPKPSEDYQTGEVHKDFKYGTKKVDRLFGRVPDSGIMNMVKALKRDQNGKLRSL